MLSRRLLFCVALFLWGCNNSTPLDRGRGAGTPHKGSAATDEVAELFEANTPFHFDFDLEDVEGNKLSKADLAGKVVIVDFWGTWCGPCRMEIPHFVALSRKYREQGLAVVGLNSEQTRDKAKATRVVRDFRQSEGVDYPCALVTDQIMNQVPNLEGFPTTLFLDRQGEVRLKVVGYHELSFLEKAVEFLLHEKAPASDGG